MAHICTPHRARLAWLLQRPRPVLPLLKWLFRKGYNSISLLASTYLG